MMIPGLNKNNPLALQAVNKGWDVWFGNTLGGKYSKKVG
jgi:hypothetical protein